MTDVGHFFEGWQRAAPGAGASGEATAEGIPIQALVYGKSEKGKMVSLQVRVLGDEPIPKMIQTKLDAQEPIYVSLPTEQATEVVPMELVALEGCKEKVLDDGRVFINAKSVQQVKPWAEVVADKALMSKQLVPMPFPTKGKGEPFLIYSGMPSASAASASYPGFHRKIEWDASETTWRGQRRLAVTFTQRQWAVKADVSPDMPVLTLKMLMWTNQCKQLLLEEGGGDELDLDSWTAIMKVNPVPFYASVCVDGKYSNAKTISLSTLAVHWDLRTYLEGSCLELGAKTVQTWIPVTASDDEEEDQDRDQDQDIINISARGEIPMGAKWRYYAMTANGAKRAEKLEKPLILFAVRTTIPSAAPKAVAEVAAAPSPAKKRSTGTSGPK
jgi:hypothetical protein